MGSEKIIVGVYDTGLNWAHEDFGDGTYAGSKISGDYDYEHDCPINNFGLVLSLQKISDSDPLCHFSCIRLEAVKNDREEWFDD